DERVLRRARAGAIAVRIQKPTLDRRAVRTLEVHPLGFAEGDLLRELVLHVCELLLARTVDVRNPDLAWRVEGANLVCHLRKVGVVVDRRDTALALRDLFDWAPCRRHAEEMCRAADATREVDVFSIGVPPRPTRQIVPRLGEVHLLPPVCRK